MDASGTPHTFHPPSVRRSLAATTTSPPHPRFRDFSPGEFVWRRSGALKSDGFRKVVTQPAMVSPYYDKVGFHREGNSFALDL